MKRFFLFIGLLLTGCELSSLVDVDAEQPVFAVAINERPNIDGWGPPRCIYCDRAEQDVQGNDLFNFQFHRGDPATFPPDVQQWGQQFGYPVFTWTANAGRTVHWPPDANHPNWPGLDRLVRSYDESTKAQQTQQQAMPLRVWDYQMREYERVGKKKRCRT